MHDLQVNRLRLFDRMAEDLAHEIKNPLNAIVINLELMKRRLHDGQTESALYRADCVTEEVRRVSALVDALFGALRLESDPGVPADVKDVLNALIPVFTLQARLAGAQLHTQTDANPGRVHLSEPILKQLMLDVVGGALEALESGNGAITIATARHGGEVVLRVGCRGLKRPVDDAGPWRAIRSLARRSDVRFEIHDHSAADSSADGGTGEACADLVLGFARVESRGDSVKADEPQAHRAERTQSRNRTMAETGTGT